LDERAEVKEEGSRSPAIPGSAAGTESPRGKVPPLLTCSRVGVSFDGVAALKDVDLTVAPEEIVGLIGPNGSGKTTLVNVISGYYRPSAGSVSFDGRPIEGHSPQDIRRYGVSRVFQNVRLYGDMTVLENLELGMLEGFSDGIGVVRSVIGGIFGRHDIRMAAQAHGAACDLLGLNGLGAVGDRRAGELSYGQRKEVELLRSIAVPPRLLLLDEPTSGVSDREADFFKQRLLEWQQEFHFSAIVIEHRLGWLFDVATRIIVLNSGRVIASGSPEEVAADPVVRSAYVGT
jgi:ABC-type branched-subunit amino acid transport system ATPase component